MAYTTIANPIYHSVLKYLMEDEAATKSLLSIFLQEEIKELAINSNELSATITDVKGKRKHVSIEIQKTKLPSEITTLRNKLAKIYSEETDFISINAETISKQSIQPIVIYLLGHKIEGLPNAVTHISTKVNDQYNKGLTFSNIPFVEALIHDMFIVQIPLLANIEVKSTIDRLLSLFDQTKVSKEDSHKINIGTEISTDKILEPVINRLQRALVDENVQKKMDLEDKYTNLQERFEKQMEQTIAKKEKAIAELRKRCDCKNTKCKG